VRKPRASIWLTVELGGSRLREGAGVRNGLRSRIWRELPFSARRAIVGTMRTVDSIDEFFADVWRSLHHSPAWLFVAVAGTAGIVLTIALFFSLTQQLLADSADARTGLQPTIEPDATAPSSPDVLDTRLSFVDRNEPPAYAADFQFGRARTHAVARTPLREEPSDEVAELPPLETVPRATTRRAAARLPDEPEGQPELIPRVQFQRHRGLETSVEQPSESLVARTAAPVADRADEWQLTPRPSDGWAEHREHPLQIDATPSLYAGESSETAIIGAAAADDDALEDVHAWPNQAEIALRLELHAPERTSLSQPGQSSLIIRNNGSETIRRLQVSESMSALETVTAALPGGQVQDDLLQREILRLRARRERTLSLDWFPQSNEPRRHEAHVLAEAFVAAVVDVTAAPLKGPLEPISAEEPEPPVRQRRTPVTPTQVEDEPESTPPAPIEQPAAEESPREETPQPRRSSIECTAHAAQTVRIGDVAEVTIDVRNTGERILHDVRILAEVPDTLRHRHGAEVEYEVGRLSPGESRQTILRVMGNQVGRAVTNLRVTAREPVEATAKARLAVVETAAAPASAPTATLPRRTASPAAPCCPCDCGPRVVWIGPRF
jgi:hypothetical protein